MTHAFRLLLSCLVVIGPSLLVGAAGASPGDPYHAAVSPTDVKPGTTTTYTIAFSNSPSSSTAANNAHVDVPGGFTVDGATLTGATTAGGGCSTAAWTVTLDTSATPAAIHAIAPPAPTDELCPGSTLLISFTATAPATEQSYSWVTTLFRDTTTLDLQGAQPAVSVDGTPPPLPTISSGPSSLSNDASPTFSFADAETTATLQCGLDGAFAPCTSPRSYAGLADGPHTFAVTATDAAGNTSTSLPYNWTIDATPPPAPTFSTAPPNVTASTSATFDFSDGDPNDTYLCSFEGSAFAACTSPQSFSGLSAGGHTFDVKAVDLAGNVGPVASNPWTIDLTNPVVTIDPTTQPPDPTNTTGASFQFTSNKPGSTFTCQLDGVGFTACTSPATYGPLGDGSHTFAVKATNPLGTTGLATVWSWTVDTLAPAAPTVASAPRSRTNSRSATISFHGGEVGLHFSCRLDGGGFVPCTSPSSYGNLADGAHTFVVSSTDGAGNVGPATPRQWVVDTAPPHTTISGVPPVVSSSPSASFGFAASEASSFVCSLDAGSFAACSSPRAYGGLHNGAHTFRVRATDLAGNVEAAPRVYSWQVLQPDTTPPGKVRRLKKSVSYGFLRLSWLLPPDADLTHVQVRRATSSSGPETSVYDGRGRKYVDRRFENGSYFVYRVRSYDGAGNASATAQVRVSPAALLRAPRDGAAVHGPTQLVWVAVPKATYYNVQLYRGSHKLLSAWPANPRRALPKRWTYQGRRFRLAKGAYRWYVWPGFGNRARAAYGKVLGTGTFVVR